MTKRIFITGIVQGVGFRPCCKKAADELGLSGTVKNLGGNAEIVIRANDRVTENFLRRLVCLLPDTARIDSITTEDAAEFSGEGFTIAESGVSDSFLPEIIPDVATCDTCIKELRDKNDRRYLHPFISCSVCGPRYSVIKRLPYDRENTLMDKFTLCEDCRREYTDPADRRLHAQTVACKNCGPVLSFYPQTGRDPISASVELLKNGGVLAVKDIGGYHFVCKPDNAAAVKRLRELKLRERKPFAVMFPDIDALREYARINGKEEELLSSPVRPIVLLEKLKDFPAEVCTDSRFLGGMLPCNPVQHMLCEALGPLVMTSGNISGEPIITDNDTVIGLCKDSAFLDAVLYHDRDIITALDDSIYYVLDGRAHLSRRGRGVAPASIEADCGERTVFAAGGDLKSCFGFYKNGKAVLSQHFGDLEDEGCEQAFLAAASHVSGLFNFAPDLTVCDMHPGYFSRTLAEKLYGKVSLPVQHHHAHIASVMAEHRLDRVLGFALDGTGYGTDGTVWGGEALMCSGAGFNRIAHLSAVKLCGGDGVSKNAAEALACYLLAGGRDISENILSPNEADLVKAALKFNINCVTSSSCGRLFDAVCALLGFGNYNFYEGMCAVALENAAACALQKGILAHPLEMNYNNNILDSVKLTLDIADAAESGADPYALALGFHYALAEGLVSVAKSQKEHNVALSGGTFNNRILTSYLMRRLEAEGFEVYLNEKVPCGDGGIALGQLYIAGRKE